MAQAISETPLENHQGKSAATLRASLAGALEGAAFTVPITLGSVTIVFSRIGPDAMAAAVIATLFALAVLHVATLGARRPVLYSARFFEATTLAAMLDQIVPRMAGWSLPDTVGVRLAVLALITAGAGLWFGILFLSRADRLLRFIPAPVFAGFANSIAVVILLSQASNLAAMLAGGTMVAALLIAVAATATAFAVRLRAPRWPAGACALAVGLVLGLVWHVLAGSQVAMLGAPGFGLRFPVQMADFAALRAPQVPQLAMAAALAGHAAVLGTMMFINTALAAQLLSQADDRPRERNTMLGGVGACMALAGIAGAAPLSGSIQSSSAATRSAPFTRRTLAFTAMLLTAVAVIDVPAAIPLAAVAGALVTEAWFMVDRTSLRNLRRWVRREPLSPQAREDLALISAVTAVAVIVNMVAAVLAGLLLGLVLFAARSARKPVRRVWTARQLASNCARPRGDLRVLDEHGDRLRVVEFERDLFFGAVESLERALKAQLDAAECIVVDWNAVRHLDSSAAQAIGKFERSAQARGVPVIHVEPHAPEVEAALGQYLPYRRAAADLDHALELAENHLLARHAVSANADATNLIEAASLFHGLGDAQRARLNDAMEQRVVSRGDALVTAGEASTALLLVLQGSCSVVLPPEAGGIRIAGVRRGSTVGEMGFLDGSLRSATVVAEEDTLVAVLTREAFDRLGRDDPHIARQVVVNIALDVSARLRHSNRLASARIAQR